MSAEGELKSEATAIFERLSKRVEVVIEGDCETAVEIHVSQVIRGRSATLGQMRRALKSTLLLLLF